MASRFSYKSKQFFFVLIKISLVVVAIYFIYQKLTKNSTLEFSYFIQILSKNGVFSLHTVVFLLFLSSFNWFFEILKWQQLVSSIQKISFTKSIEQCLGSLTVSLLTPNRIGEYGAKALYYTSRLRKRVLFINLISNLLQMLVTVVFGIIGILLLSQSQNLHINGLKFINILLIGIASCIFIILIIRKTNIKIRGFSLQKIKLFIIEFSKKSLALGAVFSFFRYLIFSFQFYYLLLLFGVEISYLEAMQLITSMYFLASIIPSIFLFDVVIKGSVALYVFSLIGINDLIILSIVTCMWILNFVLPSIIGGFYVLNFKFPENKDC
jgi:hypothetical protein